MSLGYAYLTGINTREPRHLPAAHPNLSAQSNCCTLSSSGPKRTLALHFFNVPRSVIQVLRRKQQFKRGQTCHFNATPYAVSLLTETHDRAYFLDVPGFHVPPVQCTGPTYGSNIRPNYLLKEKGYNPLFRWKNRASSQSQSTEQEGACGNPGFILSC